MAMAFALDDDAAPPLMLCAVSCTKPSVADFAFLPTDAAPEVALGPFAGSGRRSTSPWTPSACTAAHTSLNLALGTTTYPL